MSTIINQAYNLYTPERAEAVAAELQANDDSWTYKVKHDPTGKGFSFIVVYDEDGIEIAKF